MEWYLKVWKDYAVFTGRSRRTEYWMFSLFNLIAIVILFVLMSIVEIFAVLYFIYAVALIVPGIAVSIRRLHDTDKSGWFLLISFIPFVGPIILLVFMLTPGTVGPNQYGPDPKHVMA